jgi:hypothetical protein
MLTWARTLWQSARGFGACVNQPVNQLTGSHRDVRFFNQLRV